MAGVGKKAKTQYGALEGIICAQIYGPFGDWGVLWGRFAVGGRVLRRWREEGVFHMV